MGITNHSIGQTCLSRLLRGKRLASLRSPLSSTVMQLKGKIVHQLKTLWLVLIISLISSHVVYADDELGYQGRTGQESETISEILDRLRNDAKVEIRQKESWIIASSKEYRTVWSFTPKSHPAHPSYVKREVVEENGTISIKTSAKCGAEKTVCDQLIRDFIKLNNRVRDDVSSE